MAGAFIFGGWWLYQHYEVKPKNDVEPLAKSQMQLPRPTGIWPVGTDMSGGKWTLDTSSVKGPRNKRIGWITVESGPKDKLETKFAKSLYEVDCGNTGTRILSVVGYDKKGKVTFSNSDAEKAKVEFHPPGSMGDSAIAALCLEGFGP